MMINNPEMFWNFEIFAPYSSIRICAINEIWTYQNIQPIYFLLHKVIYEAFIPLIRVLLDTFDVCMTVHRNIFL